MVQHDFFLILELKFIFTFTYLLSNTVFLCYALLNLWVQSVLKLNNDVVISNSRNLWTIFPFIDKKPFLNKTLVTGNKLITGNLQLVITTNKFRN